MLGLGLGLGVALGEGRALGDVVRSVEAVELAWEPIVALPSADLGCTEVHPTRIIATTNIAGSAGGIPWRTRAMSRFGSFTLLSLR